MPRPPVPSGFTCYHCGSHETSKAGFNRGKQRFYCRACRRFFRENPALPEGSSSRTSRERRPRPKSLPSAGHLILNLQALAQRLGRTPTTADVTEQSKGGRGYPLKNYYDAFGSFTEAVRKAGLKSNYAQEYDTGLLLGELRALRAKLKRPLLGRDVLAARKKGKVSPLYHFKRAFGSVPKAIEAAGAGRRVFTRAEMIDVLRRIDADLDRPVLAADLDAVYQKGGGPHRRAVEREFGGMGKARRAAGIKSFYKKGSHKTPYWQKYTPAELIGQLKALGETLGRKPTDRDINEAGKKGMCASSTTFARMFGSLPEAYKKAGFGQVRPRSYTDEEIVAALEKLAREKGRMPTYHELVAASKAGKCPAPGTILRRIGRLAELKPRFDKPAIAAKDL